MRYILTALAGFCCACSAQAPGSEAAPESTASEAPVEVEAADTGPIRFAESTEELDARAVAAESSINPLENDLRGLEVAFRHHKAFRIKPDGAVFEMDLADLDGNILLDEDFILEPTSGVESDMLSAEAREASVIRTFRLAEADKPRMAAADAQLKQRKAEAPGQNTLNLSGGTYSCAEPEETAPDVYSLSMYFRTAEDRDFVPMMGEMLIDKVADSPFAGFWVDCATPE